MTRTLNKLSDVTVKAISSAGRYSDGGGLYLAVGPTGGKSWAFLWTLQGKKREMGLGPYPAVSLSKARQKATDCRALVADKRDPIVERDKEADVPTFAKAVDDFLEANKPAWKNDKHKAQWEMTLGDAYCRQLRPMRVSEIGTEDVLAVLKPIWLTKTETATRIRGRIERVLDFAKGKGWRSGENPALWRGRLKGQLAEPEKVKKRGHHKALAYREMPVFIERLRASPGLDARVLEFLILTAARSGEAVAAKWSEIDLDAAVWTVPASRMKAGEMHEVPLSLRAVTILNELAALRRDADFIFPGMRQGRPLSAGAMVMLLRRMKLKDVATVHGFRSSFRDWAGNETNFPREIAEAALAHEVGNKVERAYRRSTALEKRRKLMTAWADFIGSNSGGRTVVQFGRRKV